MPAVHLAIFPCAVLYRKWKILSKNVNSFFFKVVICQDYFSIQMVETIAAAMKCLYLGQYFVMLPVNRAHASTAADGAELATKGRTHGWLSA